MVNRKIDSKHKLLFSKKFPCSLNFFFFFLQTDDKGVFATHLSQEYQLAAETFNLTQTQVWDLSYESINYIFASDSTRSELRRKWNHLKPRVLYF